MSADVPFAKKSLGQHWLHDSSSLHAMLTAAQVTKDDTVLEIGPGLGTLTQLLVREAQHVVAVEFDSVLAEALPRRVPADNLEIIRQDILRYNLTALPAGYKVVANIPYYLTSHLLRILSETANPPARAALLVQKEVAERVAAKPGDMSLLSVTTQFYWQVTIGTIVPARLFKPAPKVDSQILILERRAHPLLPGIDPKHFFHVVKAGFSQRRKTLLNSLSAGLRISRHDAADMLDSSGIAQTARPQELSLEQWAELARHA